MGSYWDYDCKIPGPSQRASIHRSHRPSANNAISEVYESYVTDLEKLATSDKATIVIERRTELKCGLRQGLG
jgi:hypothetical protein